MNMLILVVTIVWSFDCGGYNPSTYIIVKNPEQAAIYIHNDKPSSFQVEPDQKEHKLYDVNFKDNTITEISIPKLIFQ